jgi:uncharacterized ferritin-like protein (DUF455 family)
MNIDTLLEQAIVSDDIDIKARLTTHCLAYCNQNEISVSEDFVPRHFCEPSYASKCQIVDPRALPARKDFETKEGLATLVHAIAHIEYSAIDLALDAVYRYPDMPLEYKIDWLEVASDEIRHYQMLETILNDLEFSYGDFPVHCGLFDAAEHTAHNILHRMAVIPRYYEASGLDVSPQILKKLDNRRKNSQVKRVMDALTIIYNEEIDHVQKGDKWFKYLCKEAGVDTEEESAVYFEILEHYDLLSKHRPHINVAARKEAGFSCTEIQKLGAKECS